MLIHNSQIKPEKYEIDILGLRFIQYRDVFPADMFNDAEFFTSSIINETGKDFLEIGIGSGVTSVVKALKGYYVTGVDINPSAIRNATENAKLHKVESQCRFITSDLFTEIRGQKYDIIYWNTPFCHCTKSSSVLEKSILDYRHESLERFLSEAKYYLKSDGMVLLGFSNLIGDVDKLHMILKKYNYTNIEIQAQKVYELTNYEYDLTLYSIKN